MTGDIAISRRSFLKAIAMTAATAGTLSLSWHVLRNTKPEHVFLQPFGTATPLPDSDRIRAALFAVYGIPVRILPSLPLPQSAFYPPRNRYRADRLLEVLRTRLPANGTRILGLTSADISITKGDVHDWGVLGLARIAGTSGVVSSFRCAHGARDAVQASERFVKVAVHELGHCFGLSHCPSAHCIMHDAESRIATVDGSHDLCDICRAGLAATGIHVSARRSLF